MRLVFKKASSEQGTHGHFAPFERETNLSAKYAAEIGEFPWKPRLLRASRRSLRHNVSLLFGERPAMAMAAAGATNVGRCADSEGVEGVITPKSSYSAQISWMLLQTTRNGGGGSGWNSTFCTQYISSFSTFSAIPRLGTRFLEAVILL